MKGREEMINNNSYAEKYSRVIVIAGVLLFLVSLINGFLIHLLPLQRLALSAHFLGLIASSLLIGLGSFWPRLHLSQRLSRLGAIFITYGFWAGWAVYFSAAALGAGGMFPILAGGNRASPMIELSISLGMLTVALALFSSMVIILNGLLRENKPSRKS